MKKRYYLPDANDEGVFIVEKTELEFLCASGCNGMSKSA